MPDRGAYLVDVRALLQERGSCVELDTDVEMPTLASGASVFAPVGCAHVQGRVTAAGAGLVLAGEVSATVRTACSRCLQEFPLHVTGELEGFYVAHGQESELPGEQEYEYIEDGAIDIMQALVSAVILELPFAPLHDENCAGICPHCGADLTEGPCACEPDSSRSPFSALEGLLSPKRDE